MALVNSAFTVNVTPGTMPPVVHVSEYDVGRTYTVTINGENGSAFNIPTGTTATVEGTLNGAIGFTTNATISGSTVSFTLTESMTAKSGKAWCKIKLTLNDEPIQTCAFVLAVDRAGVEAETVIGASGFEEQIQQAAEDWLEDQGFHSPTVSVEEITGGHRVTFTDAEHPQGQSFDVMNGFGIPEDVKVALLDCFENVAWINDQGQTYYDALYAALYPPKTLVSISAVFSQGSAVIYDTDSLDTLRQYLTVTATYDDTSTGVITNYTLSGTLTEGTSTITVSYNGKTTTFDVTVTGIIPAEYQRVEYIANPSDAYIVTTIPVALGDTVHVRSSLSAKPSATANVCGGTAINQNRAYVSYSTSNNYVGAWVGYTNCFPLVADLYSSVLESWTTVSSGSVHFKCKNASVENEKTVTSEYSTALTALELFRAGSAGGAFVGRVYFLEVLSGETATARLYPCYRKSDNKIGMYDTVNSKFYTSANSTAFTKGANV